MSWILLYCVKKENNVGTIGLFDNTEVKYSSSKFFWQAEIINYVPYKQSIIHSIPKYLTTYMTGNKS